MEKPFDDSTSNSSVSNDEKSVNEKEEVARVPTYGIDLDFGDALYWNNGTLAVRIQTITPWIYHVHPKRKKRTGNRLNLTSQYQYL